MSTTVPPRDGDARTPSPSQSALPDEDALRHAFLSEFASLDAAARTQLGADAAGLSHKVVEGAFVRAWDARAQFTTSEQVHQFLVDDVHHAAARALSRRAAAHRLAGTNHDTHEEHHARTAAVNDVEESWGHIMHALHGEAHSPKVLAESAAISRHEAAEHISVIAKERSWWLVVGFAAIALAIAVGIVMGIDRLGASAKVTAAVNAADARVVTSLPAQIGVVTLDDGSKVRLAPESKLSIPKAFGPKLRAVKLEGAATFDVASGQGSDFQVYARDAVATVKGTSFTVRDYPGDSAVTIVVAEGAVSVRQGKTTHELPAGQALIVPDGAAARAASADERDAADGWRTGTLAITQRPLRDVLPQLRRWYGITVLVPQTELLDRQVTLRASLDSSRQAIRGVEQSANVNFGYSGQNMIFSAPTAKAATKGGKR